jgi:hypothetical protein
MYEINGWIKFAEKDEWGHGRDPDTGVSYSGNNRFSADTIEDLLQKVRDFFGMPDSYEFDLDPMDEGEGRADISFLETAEGYCASKRDIEQWKKGECDLWSACYTFYVEEVTRKPAKFKLETVSG